MKRNRNCRWLSGYVFFIALYTAAVLFPGAAQANFSKPLLFLVAGQSNARGAADRPSSIVVPSGAFWNGDTWVHTIKDPVSPSRQGSLCPALAKVISDRTRRKVYIVNVSVSGSSSNEACIKNDKKSWSRTGFLRKRAVSIYKRAVSKMDDPFEFGGVIWLQGETEAKLLSKGHISLYDAQAGFQDVYKWLTNTFGKVFIIGIGYRNGDTRSDPAHEQINRIIMQLAYKTDNCYFASNMPMKLRNLGLMQRPVKAGASNPHYLIRGYELVGEDAGKFIANLMKRKN